jgi:hypothetical protein
MVQRNVTFLNDYGSREGLFYIYVLVFFVQRGIKPHRLPDVRGPLPRKGNGKSPVEGWYTGVRVFSPPSVSQGITIPARFELLLVLSKKRRSELPINIDQDKSITCNIELYKNVK